MTHPTGRSVVLLTNPPRDTMKHRKSHRRARKNPAVPMDSSLTKRAMVGVPAMAVGGLAAAGIAYAASRVRMLDTAWKQEAAIAGASLAAAVGAHALGQDRVGLAVGGAGVAIAGGSVAARTILAPAQAPATSSQTPALGTGETHSSGFAGVDANAYNYMPVWGGR